MSEPSNSNPRFSSHTDKNTLTSLNNVSTKKFRRKKIFFSAKNFSLESSNVENKDNGGKGHLGTMLIKLFSSLSVFLVNRYNFLLGGSLHVGEHDAYSKSKLLSLHKTLTHTKNCIRGQIFWLGDICWKRHLREVGPAWYLSQSPSFSCLQMAILATYPDLT